VGPRACLDAVEKRKIFSPHRESKPDRPGRIGKLTLNEVNERLH